MRRRIADGVISAEPPRAGDRMPYVIVGGAKAATLTDRAEHPDWVVQKELPVDMPYYMVQLRSAITKITNAAEIDGVEEMFDDAINAASRLIAPRQARASGQRLLTDAYQTTNKPAAAESAPPVDIFQILPGLPKKRPPSPLKETKRAKKKTTTTTRPLTSYFSSV